MSWLRQFLALPNDIPSHKMFRRVFMLIASEPFEACFMGWVGAVATPSEREVIVLDGKTVRGSFNRSREQSPLHLVSVARMRSPTR